MEFNPKQLEIIRIAEQLFAEKGFSGTSVRDISQVANINVSMISYYFGSKEKLIEAVFTSRSQELLRRFEMILHKDDVTPMQKVYLMIDDVLDRMLEKKCFHNIMVREQLSGNNRTPLITDLVQRIKRNHLQAIQSIISEGQQRGAFKKDVDVLMLYTTLVGTFNQAITTQYLYRITKKLEKLSQEALELDIKKNVSSYLKHLFRIILTQDVIAASEPIK